MSRISGNFKNLEKFQSPASETWGPISTVSSPMRNDPNSVTGSPLLLVFVDAGGLIHKEAKALISRKKLP